MSRRSITLMDPRRMFRDDVFDEFFGQQLGVSMSDYSLNMYEDDDQVVVELEAPSFSPEDVDITVEDTTLNISGTAKVEDEKSAKKYYHKEIRQQDFSRSVTLPVKVKADKAEATFINGIIKIALPKADEVKPRKISIKGKSE